MKKIYFYILVIILTSSQFANSQNYRFGLHGGINKCGLFGPDIPNVYEKQFGYNGGLYLDSRISEFMSTVFEANYSMYRFSFSEFNIDSLNNRYLTIKENNHFLTVPFMLRYKRGYEFAFVYLNAGVQVSLLLKNNRESTLYINDLQVDADYYYGYTHNWYDYGLVGGGGIQIKAVNIDFKYYFSTRNMYTREDAREMRYNILSLELGYQFNYKDKHFYGRKTGWKGLKYKILHMFK